MSEGIGHAVDTIWGLLEHLCTNLRGLLTRIYTAKAYRQARSDMDKVDKVKIMIYILVRASIVATGTAAILRADWTNLALSVVTLLLTFLPAVVRKQLHIHYRGKFEIIILLYIYASMYMGEIYSFYHRFWWWDIMLHTLSGVIIGAIGFSLVYMLNEEERVAMELSPAFVAIFSFGFALSIGALWEIFEFLMDSLFGLNMQKSGLVDTMWDLIVDALGALVISVLGYFHLKSLSLGNIRLKGNALADVFAIASTKFPAPQSQLASHEVAHEVERFQRAIETMRGQQQQDREKVAHQLGTAMTRGQAI